MSANKRGRPPLDEPRTLTIGIRITPTEKKLLKEACSITGMTPHDILFNNIEATTKEDITNRNLGINVQMSNNTDEIILKIKKEWMC